MKEQKGVDQVIYFLKEFNDQFAIVRCQIMLIDPLSLMNCVFSLLIQQERQMLFEMVLDSKTHINAVDSTFAIRQNVSDKANSSFGQHSKKLCTHYGKSGHTVDVCYRKHGFPPGFKFRNPSKNVNAIQTDAEDPTT